jgi:hypothetical protein
MGPKIHWVQNYVTDDKIYCLYIAPDEETVRAHAQRGGFPANAVARVRAVLITLHDFCEMACNSGRGSFPTPGWPQSLRCFDDRRQRITDLAVAALPWLLTMLVFMVIVTYWPGLTLFLPRLLGMM